MIRTRSSTVWLDETGFHCEFARAWRKTNPRQRRATCSLTFCQLPPCKPSPGDWRLAERWFFPASPRRRSHFSPRCCNNFSRNGRWWSSPKISRRRKASSRIWKRGIPNFQLPTPNSYFIPPGKRCRTRTNCRTPTSSATACKRSLPFLTIQNSKLKTQNSLSPALPRCCKKLFRPAKSSPARVRWNAARKRPRST